MSILYDYLARLGRLGDTELAHVNPEEQALLQSRGGAGTVNPNTGLKEYHDVPGSTHYNYGEMTWDDGGQSGSPVTKWAPSPSYIKDTIGDNSNFHYHQDSTNVGPSEIFNYSYMQHADHGQQHVSYTDKYEQPEGMQLQRALDEKEGERDRIGGLSGWATEDLSGEEFMKLTEEERQLMVEDITGYELDYEDRLRAEDYKRYMPKYDIEKELKLGPEERKMEIEGAEDIGAIGEARQTSLLNLYNQQQNKGRGFAETGNPMIDRQRENIFKDIETRQETRYETMVEGRQDIWDKKTEMQEDYMEDWETGFLDYISGVRAQDPLYT